MELCLKLCHEKTIILFDDTNLSNLNNLCSKYVRSGKLKDYHFKEYLNKQKYKHRFFQVNPTIPVYISITSIFQNQDILLQTLQSIMNQTRKPDKIFLYLSEESYIIK